MSIAYLAWAMDTIEPRQTARLVLFVLAEMASDHVFSEDEDAPVWEAICWPSVERVAEKARASRRQTFAALAQLEELGLVRTVETTEELRWFGRPITTTIRQIRGGADFAPLPGAENSTGGVRPTAPKPRTEPLEEEANASPSKSPAISDDAGTNTEVPPPASDRYLEPASPGAAAAPWLVLELARLMRLNDPKAKLPVGLRGLMALEYLEALGRPGGEWSTREKRRELIAPVAHKPGTLKWLDSMRLLVDTDEREAREVAQVVRWCQGDDFWKGNILSADKFREQYPKLRARWLEENGGAGARSGVTNRPDRGPSTAAQLDALAGRR